jgi:anti-anti-sigma factor
VARHPTFLPTDADGICRSVGSETVVTWPDVGPVGRLTLGLSFSTARAVVVVRGELDSSTAPELGAVLGGLADRGYRSVVLDLAECDLIDSAGLRVIAENAEQLALWGRSLSIRSPSGVVGRLFDLVGPAGVKMLEGSEDLPVAALDLRRSVDAGRLAATVADLAPATPRLGAPAPASVAHEEVDGALRLVVALARALVGGADGASVSLRRHDRLATVAASDETVLAMDADQYATGQGPCVDASTVGERFHTDSLVSETRWPAFIPQAQALGINAIVSSPLLVADRPVGALNIYSRTADAFSSQAQELAALFATEASTVLSDAEAGSAARSAWFAAALETRQVIAVAQGVLMERDSVDRTAAYRSLRRFSSRTSRPLRERAEDIIASSHPPAGLPPTSSEHLCG